VEALLQGAEAAAACVVEADDLAVEHRRAGECFLERRDDVREECLLGLVVPADEADAAAVEAD
jgi:hypothetical protein